MKSTGCKVVAPSIADAIINRTEAKIAEKDEKEEMFLFWKKWKTRNFGVTPKKYGKKNVEHEVKQQKHTIW